MAFLLLIILVVLLIYIFFEMGQKINFHNTSQPHPIFHTIRKLAIAPQSAAVVTTAKPVNFQEQTDQPKVTFDFYTTLPKMTVKVNSLDAEENNQSAANINYYILQLASFRDLKKAKIFETEVQGKGFHTNIIPIMHQASTWYRIQIGPIKRFQKADKLRQQLQNQGIDSILLSFNKL